MKNVNISLSHSIAHMSVGMLDKDKFGQKECHI